jgi:hypothetical protein
MSRSPYPCKHFCDVQLNQAANGVNSNYGALVDLLESIEGFLRRAAIYIWIPPTAVMDETVFNIIVELLSVLALATKKFKQGRSSEYVPR